MLLSSSAEQGEIDARRAGDALQGLRLRRQGGRRRDGPAARGASRSRSTCRRAEALEAVLDSPYTRYPVYRETLDEIVGILHVRDLVAAMHDPDGIAPSTSRSSLRPATMVPETKDLAALLTEFRRTNQHMAIVIDEYGDGRGDRHARGSARGDRRRDRGRVRPARRDGRAGRRRHDPDRRHVLDRRLQRGVRRRPADRGLPHDRRLRVRPARPRRRARATRSPTTASSSASTRSRASGSTASPSRSGRGAPPPSTAEHDDS